MKLYAYWRSSCSWRVRIALAIKGIEHELAPIHLLEGGGQQNQEGFVELNPMRQVPLLQWEERGHTLELAQSMAILDFLEERYPTPSLLPEDSYLRAKARQLAEMVNAGIQPLQNLYVMQQLKARGVDAREVSGHFITRGLRALEIEARALPGAFCVGDRPSYADLCLIPQLYNARRFDLDLTPYPTLRAVEAQCEALPAFIASHPDQQPDATQST